MKVLFILVTIISCFCMACHEQTVGFLVTEDASYDPDSLVIRKIPDPEEDRVRIEYNAPWISTDLQGYEGTAQIQFDVESVSSSLGEEAARVFQEELSIRGGGYLMYPLKNNAKPGRYVVSVRLSNPGYSQVIKDAFTFIVE